MRALTFGSLFSGIGGLDLGLERAGMTVKWQAENDAYCSAVLAKHWPHIPNLGDVTRVEWGKVERVDLICGGYPCQPFSLAGARRGHDDERHLWPYFRDALRVLRPRLALLENVPGHLSLGFGRVLGDLAELGYNARWDCIPAVAVGAPHLRYRVFVVASADRDRESGVPDDGRTRPRLMVSDAVPIGGGGGTAVARDDGPPRPVADAESVRRARLRCVTSARHGLRESERRHTSDGGAWSAGAGIRRVAHGVPHRVDRLRGLGNAVVPQVAEFIGAQLLASLDSEIARAGCVER